MTVKSQIEAIGSKKTVIVISAVVRILIGLFLLFTAYAKFVSADYYLKFLVRLGVPSIVAFNSVTPLIALELFVGGLLVAGYRTRVVLRFTSFLFVAFTAIVLYSLFVKIDVSCGCFGPYFKSEINILSVLRNLCIAIVTFLISIYRRYPFTVDSRLAKKADGDPGGL